MKKNKNKQKNQPKQIVLEKVNFGLPNLTKPKKKSLGTQLWGPIICGSGPFLHWGPRPEPRKGIAKDV